MNAMSEPMNQSDNASLSFHAMGECGRRKLTVSVIIPNYNHGHLLERCIGALLNQSRRPDEIIIVDDASADNSRGFLRKLSKEWPISVYFLPERRGPSYANNFAMKLCHGDCLYFSAADDVVKPGFFEKSLGVLERHPQAGLCSTETTWRELDTGLSWTMGLGVRGVPDYISPEDLERMEKGGRCFISSNAVIVRRDPLVTLGG